MHAPRTLGLRGEPGPPKRADEGHGEQDDLEDAHGIQPRIRAIEIVLYWENGNNRSEGEGELEREGRILRMQREDEAESDQ